MRFEGSRAKLRWAKKHFDLIETEINKFLGVEPYKVAVERPTQTLAVIRVIETPKEMPPFDDWALVIGDCVHNARAALDYIAWELAGSVMQDKTTLFPIFETVGGWTDNSRKRIKRLPYCAQTMIKAVQPCFHDSPNTAFNGLRILDDADKHKLLTVTAVVQDKVHLNVKGISAAAFKATQMRFFDLPLEYDTILATIAFPDFVSPNVNVEARFTPAIAFGERLTGGKHNEVLASLRNILKDVGTTVDNFERKFGTRYGAVPFYRHGAAFIWPPSTNATLGP